MIWQRKGLLIELFFARCYPDPEPYGVTVVVRVTAEAISANIE